MVLFVPYKWYLVTRSSLHHNMSHEDRNSGPNTESRA